ncbi:MAG: hypothetical protein C6W56_07150 [Caldibacillus debilis]|nr:MAG: hypothetical protein C6W56_07150 [Caldibacillus debilis]
MLKEGNGIGASEGQIWPCGRLFNFKKISSSFIPGFLHKERIFSEGDFSTAFSSGGVSSGSVTYFFCVFHRMDKKIPWGRGNEMIGKKTFRKAPPD